MIDNKICMSVVAIEINNDESMYGLNRVLPCGHTFNTVLVTQQENEYIPPSSVDYMVVFRCKSCQKDITKPFSIHSIGVYHGWTQWIMQAPKINLPQFKYAETFKHWV